MRCPYCGEFLPDTASFCRTCMHTLSPVSSLRNKSAVRLFMPYIWLCSLLLLGIAGIWVSKSFAVSGAMTSSVLSTGVKNEETSSSGLKEENVSAIKKPESSSQSLKESSQTELSSQAVSSQEVISQQTAGQTNHSEGSQISSDSPSSQSPGVSQNTPEISTPPAPSLDRDALIAASRSQFDSWLTYSPAARSSLPCSNGLLDKSDPSPAEDIAALHINFFYAAWESERSHLPGIRPIYYVCINENPDPADPTQCSLEFYFDYSPVTYKKNGFDSEKCIGRAMELCPNLPWEENTEKPHMFYPGFIPVCIPESGSTEEITDEVALQLAEILRSYGSGEPGFSYRLRFVGFSAVPPENSPVPPDSTEYNPAAQYGIFQFLYIPN